MYWLYLLSTIVLAAVIAVGLYLHQSGNVTLPLTTSQPTLLIVGPTNSGKTSLFQRLVHGKKDSATYTSQRVNIGNLVLENGKRIKVIDSPGHPKLFSNFKSHVPTSIAFVLDSSTIAKNADVVTRSFLEVLTFGRKLNIKEIVIFANKSDFFTSLSTEKITDLIETEVEQIRKQKDGVRMDSIEEKIVDDDEDWLQDLSGPFKLKDECNIYGGSVLKDDVQPWQEWVESVFS